MESSRPKAEGAVRFRSSAWRKQIAGYESVSYGSTAKRVRLLCWPCYNAEVAQADGLDSFQHVDFEPMRLLDCEGTPHEFRFRLRLLDPSEVA